VHLRTNDVSRSIGIDPVPGSGVIAEVVTWISTTQIISPFGMGGNLDEPGTTTIYANQIKNLSWNNLTNEINLTILQLEAVSNKLEP
jgi:hypothetical protein